jgi:D-galactose 1-dehydrogenase
MRVHAPSPTRCKPATRGMAEIRIGIVGFGKIAREQHAPAIAQNPSFRLAGAVTGAKAPPGIPTFADVPAMLREIPLDAVAVCTPPSVRYAIARDCLDAGLHLLLEKPPASTLGEIASLQSLAGAKRRTLFTTWHAQHNRAVELAADITRRDGIASLQADWLENVEKWHPGQQWIWRPGGFGVFDAGINALSIATMLSPGPLLVTAADFVLHHDGQQPIAADLALAGPAIAGPVRVRLDWRHKGDERWTVAVTTNTGQRLLLSRGGSLLRIGDAPPAGDAGGEYPSIYRRFAELIGTQASHVDAEPLRITADAMMLARRINSRPGAGASG